MQTFLPSKSYAQSAKFLDWRRLGKQRVEALQILNCLTVKPSRWKNHPAVLMWKGYEGALCVYGLEICLEWRKRGYRDKCLEKFAEAIQGRDLTNPPWLGDERLHKSHRSNLLRKLPKYYSQFGWSEPPNLEYFWPIRLTNQKG